jgi:glucosamine--fructose-6-phosphate aminotransferase (isomerizing)
MCGIFAYAGKKHAAPLLIDGLKTLEYRGYDSAGMFLPDDGLFKSVGAVANLEKKIPFETRGTVGIAHTRWATHGIPSERNAHPHTDCTEQVYVVHNGIIENHALLREELTSRGHTFCSDTDTEVLAHLVEEYASDASSLEDALRAMLTRITGTYGIALMHKKFPDTIAVARMGSPLVLGIGNGEFLVASDPSPLLRHTKDVVYLDDGECAVLSKQGYRVFRTDNTTLSKTTDHIDWDIEEVQKGGYLHFMLKEIMESPEVLENTMRGRIVHHEHRAKLGGLESVEEKLRTTERLTLVGCGSAYYAGLIGQYLLERYAGIPTNVELGSEFRYRSPVFEKNSAMIVISQSGETADTLASLREAQQNGILTLGIVNVVGSTIARETDAGVYNHAGPEIGVASTKAFISQIEALILLTLFLGRQRGMPKDTAQEITEALTTLPDLVQKILDTTEDIERVAKKYVDARDVLYIGRAHHLPIALEGALKLKEVSYIHAEGYGAGEMKHGPIAMIDEKFPTVAIALSDALYEKMLSNIQEIRARRGPIIAIATEGNTAITKLADDVLYVPKSHDIVSPILSVIPLQLLAYYVGVAKGLNVDRPRNLAKSVTVE